MHAHRRESEQGVAMLALILVLTPLLILVGSYLQTMSGRNSRLQLEIKEERAMMVAESGIDVAIYNARLGNLVAGHLVTRTYTGTLAGGGSYSSVCTYLGDDDVDNDGDAQVDEADENVYRVVSTGTLGGSMRRVAVYLGFTSFLTAPGSTFTMLNQNPTDITISGTPTIDGKNYTLAGALAGSGNTYGITIAAPAPTTRITTLLTAGEASKVLGVTAAPSVEQTTTYTTTIFNNEVTAAINAAQIIITNAVAASQTWGTTAAPQIVYRNGNLKITGNSTGAGLLVVNGNLQVTGTMTWYGVILVNGTFDAGTGTARVYGGVVTGPTGTIITVKGTCDLRYSTAAIALATNLTGRYVAFNGWQEVSTN